MQVGRFVTICRSLTCSMELQKIYILQGGKLENTDGCFNREMEMQIIYQNWESRCS